MQIKEFPSKSSIENQDLLLVQDAIDNAYKKVTKADLLSGVSSGGSGSGVTPWLLKTANYTASSGDRLMIDTSQSSWLLTLPPNPSFGSEIEIYGLKGLDVNKLDLDIGQNLFKGKTALTVNYSQLHSSTKLIYTTSSIGWIDTNNLAKAGGYYSQEVLNDLPYVYLRLNEASGTTAIDESVNNRSCQYEGTITYQQESSLPSEPTNKSVRLTPNARIIINPQITSPSIFALECKFKSTATGGAMFGFDGGGGYDRDLYLVNGNIRFLIFNGATITTPNKYNDDKWHIVTATLNSRGAEIWVDGVLTISSANINNVAYTGNWLVGYGRYGGYFNGLIDEASITHANLTSDRIQARHAAAV